MLTCLFFSWVLTEPKQLSKHQPNPHIMYNQPQYYYPPHQYYYLPPQQYGYSTYPYVPAPMPVHPQALTDAEQLKDRILEYVEQSTQVGTQTGSTQAVDACTETTEQVTTSTSIQTVTSMMVHTATQSEDDGRKQLIRQLEKVVTKKKTQVKQLEVTFKKKKDVLESTNNSYKKSNIYLQEKLEEERMKFDGLCEQVMALKTEKQDWGKQIATLRDQLKRMVEKWKEQRQDKEKLIENNYTISRNFSKIQREYQDKTSYFEKKETAFHFIRCFAPRMYVHMKDFAQRLDAPKMTDDIDDAVYCAEVMDRFHAKTRKQLDTMRFLMDAEWMDWYAASPNREEWLHHLVCPLLLLPGWP
tara:strand:- start:6770 stop:7840 length:1071 start_codon:yes stop_codon:yes gene_type:complete